MDKDSSFTAHPYPDSSGPSGFAGRLKEIIKALRYGLILCRVVKVPRYVFEFI